MFVILNFNYAQEHLIFLLLPNCAKFTMSQPRHWHNQSMQWGILGIFIWEKHVYTEHDICCPWNHELRPKKNFQLVWLCHQLLSGFLAKGHLLRMSHQSRRSLMIRVILGAVHRSPGICLTAEENPRKPQLGDRLMKGAVRPVIASNEVPFVQMRSVRSHSTPGKEKEGKTERI